MVEEGKIIEKEGKGRERRGNKHKEMRGKEGKHVLWEREKGERQKNEGKRGN